MSLNEIEKGDLCKTTVQCLSRTQGNLSVFPGLLKKIIRTRAWKRREHNGRIYELPSLLDLVTRKPLEGWGEDPKRIEALIKHDPEALEMWNDEMKQKPGPKPDNYVHNVNETKRKKGNAKAHSLSVLKRKAPDMFQAVCNGEMSANAAMIAAGLRKPVVTVSSDPASALKTLKSKFGDEFIRELKRILNN